VQYLIDQFWIRWRKEYLQSIQKRNKWFNPHKNLEIGDVVLISDDNVPRNDWRLGRVTKTHMSDDN